MNEPLFKKGYADLETSLRRCSSTTIEAALRYRESGDPSAIPVLVFGILERYQPSTAAVKLSAANDEARLIEDIGLDSLTLFEIVMVIEEVFKISIANDELREMRTVNQLNEFLRAKVVASSAAP